MSQIKIGRWQGAGLLATTLLGSSVFILPQITINIANSGAMTSWLLLILSIIPVTFVFAKLASHFPHAAGPAYFIEQAFGKISGKTIGLMFLCAVPLGVPAGILMTQQFITSVVELNQLQQWLVQMSMLLAIFLLNLRGLHISARFQLILTCCIMMTVLAILLALGLTNQPTKPIEYSLTTSQIDPIFIAAGLAFWSFLGVEAMAHLSADFKNPKKDLLPAMLVGTILVGLVYLACCYILLSLPNEAPVSMVSVFNQLLGGNGELIICSLGVAGGIATINVYTASTAKLFASFSDDGILPRYFRQKNQFNVPIRALITLLAVMAVVLTTTLLTNNHLEELIFWVNGVFIIIYLLSILAATKLLNGRYKIAIYSSTIFCFIIIWGLGTTMLYAIGLMTIIVPALLWQQRFKKRRSALV